jgi:ATP-dependent DNA ligase
VKKGKATLWSRTRKPITGLPHINKAVEELGLKDIVLDGELYNHDYRNNFEDLTSFIRNPEPKEGHEVVQYHVYDIAGEGSFRLRNGRLSSIVRYEPLVRVETKEVNDEDELIEFFEDCLSKGYEGAMVRNAAGLYVGKRSVDLLKIKEFQDAEFEIVDVEEGRGKLAGKAIFVCANKQGTKFKAKMKGDQDELAKFWKKPSLAIGRMLTVQYQGLTGKNGVPRFPVGLRFREDI